MTMQDILMWSGTEFIMAGYTVRQIQKEKKSNVKTDDDPPKESEPKLLND